MSARKLHTRLKVKPRTGPPKTTVGAMGWWAGGALAPTLWGNGAPSRFLRISSARSCLATSESVSRLERSFLTLPQHTRENRPPVSAAGARRARGNTRPVGWQAAPA